MGNRWRGALVGMLFASGIAGCVGDAADGPDADDAPGIEGAVADVSSIAGANRTVEILTDAAGDARVWDANSLHFTVENRCGYAPASLQERCRDTVPAPDVGTGGAPAPPELDILSLTFTETPESLVVDLGMASVDPEFPNLAGDGYTGTAPVVCWTTTDIDRTRCTESVALTTYRTDGDLSYIQARYDHDAKCNTAEVCDWAVPYELIAGAPGTIRWHVPRTIIANGTIGDSIVGAYALITRLDMPTPGPQPVPSASATAAGQGTAFAPPSTPFYIADFAGIDGDQFTADDFTFSIEAAPRDLGAPTGLPFPDVEGDYLRSPERADHDILAVDLVETPTTMTVAVQVAQVGEPVEGDHFSFAIGTWHGPFVNARYVVVEGGRVGGAFVIEDRAFTRQSPIPVRLTVALGSPGWLNATFNRTDLGSPRRGDLITDIGVAVGSNTITTIAPDGDDPVAVVTVQQRASLDNLGFLPPYWFKLDTEAPSSDVRGVSIADRTDDAALQGAGSLALLGSGGRQFEIMFVSAEGATDTESKLILGVGDLSRISVPADFTAAVYAVGVETGTGQFMVGYYRAQDQPGEWFCSQDTAVFLAGPERYDPAEVVWQQIDGLIAVGHAVEDEATGAAASGSSLVFFVPHTCFGQEQPGPVQVNRFAAATFLVRASVDGAPPMDAFQSMYVVDEVATDEPFTIASIAAPRAPWYTAPFGLENFWDIAGLVLAILAFLVGALAVQRRQRRLKRYLAAVKTAAAQKDPRVREVALRDLREQVSADLTRRRLSENHYVIVEVRLEEHLTQARVAVLTETFGELPVRLMAKLQDLLADGEMSEGDYRVFATMLEQTHLTKAGKENVRKALRSWVREDAPVRKRARRS